MKKISAIIATTALAATLLVGCGGSSAPKYKDGTYTGEAHGAVSNIKVEVTVKDGELSDVKVIEQGETATLFAGVEENLIPEIIKNKSTEKVETISGATLSSEAIIESVNQALEAAK